MAKVYYLRNVDQGSQSPKNAPTLTVAGATVSSLILTWSAVTTATTYTIRRKINGIYSPIATVAGLTYTDSGLPASTAQSYTVSAINQYGEGPQSAPAGNSTNAAPVGPPATGNVNWYPGVYMLSVNVDGSPTTVTGANGFAGNGRNAPEITRIVASIKAFPTIFKGYSPQYTWPFFDGPTLGAYNFAPMIADFNACVSAATTAGVTCLFAPQIASYVVWNGGFSSTAGQSIVPPYVYNGTTYGNSPLGGTGANGHGWHFGQFNANPVSAWNSGTAYAVGASVFVGDVSKCYVCTTANTGQTPPNATYWAVTKYSYVHARLDNANTNARWNAMWAALGNTLFTATTGPYAGQAIAFKNHPLIAGALDWSDSDVNTNHNPTTPTDWSAANWNAQRQFSANTIPASIPNIPFALMLGYGATGEVVADQLAGIQAMVSGNCGLTCSDVFWTGSTKDLSYAQNYFVGNANTGTSTAPVWSAGGTDFRGKIWSAPDVQAPDFRHYNGGNSTQQYTQAQVQGILNVAYNTLKASHVFMSGDDDRYANNWAGYIQAGIVAAGVTPNTALPAAYVAPKPVVSIAGGKFVDGNGVALNLRGANCYDGSYTQGGTGFWDFTGWQGTPPTPDFNMLKNTWKGNVVRLTGGAQSWLSQTTLKLSSIGMTYNGGNSFSLPATVPSNAVFVNMNGDGQYQTKFKAVVDQLTALGFYVVIDLHYCGPDVTIGGTNYHIYNAGGGGQSPMPDANGLAFWTQVATMFKGYPNVMFDLYNEPGSNTQIPWATWKNGAAMSTFIYNDGIQMSGQGYAIVNMPWTCVGMQALLNAVRNTGATNVCLCGGIEYAAELGNNGFADSTSSWLLSRPTDPLNQLGAALHVYSSSLNGNAYGGANYALYAAADNNPLPPYQQWLPFVKSINTAGFPVFIGEFAGVCGPATTYPNEPFVTSILNAIDSVNSTNGAGSIGAAMWSFTPNGTNSPIINSGATVVPNGGTGVAVKNWMAAHT